MSSHKIPQAFLSVLDRISIKDIRYLQKMQSASTQLV